MGDFEAILEAYKRAGGDPSFLRSSKVGSLVVHGHQVLGLNAVAGVRMEPEEMEHGVRVKVWVEPGTRLEWPVHLCFGVLPKEGRQEILPTFEIGEGARVEFLAHCTFPNAEDVVHLMEAQVHVAGGPP